MMLTVECLCYEKIIDLLVLYAMKMLIESCHEMLMELECTFMLCNMSHNVSYVICHAM